MIAANRWPSSDPVGLLLDRTTATTAAQAQIDAVLAGADSFIIRAEYWSGDTPDTTFLDNVILATPEPGTVALGALALAGLGAHLLVKRRRQL